MNFSSCNENLYEILNSNLLKNSFHTRFKDIAQRVLFDLFCQTTIIKI